jgi:anti-sigma B factor antagonist
MTLGSQTTSDTTHPGAAPPDTDAARVPGDLHIDMLDTASPTVLRLIGALDEATAPRLRQDLVALAEAGETSVVIDLASMSFVDSTGLGALVGGLKRFRALFGDVVLRSPTPAARKVLDMTGLTEVFTIE